MEEKDIGQKKQMGVKYNSKNEPDINGYELKKFSNKITLGDFSASEYIFSKQTKEINLYNNWDTNINITKEDYIKIFGEPNLQKNNRYSWSGSCVPKYNIWNYCGQIIIINDNNDIIIKYSYSKDTRKRKTKFPDFIKKDELVIALWKSDKMANNINNKFNQKGFFICKKIDNTYQQICFGNPFNFNNFIQFFKTNKIIFDSGMYEGNNRNYSHFRGSGKFWKELIIEEY